MLNMSNHIYVDAGSLRSTDSKQNEDYFAYIIEYLFLHAYEKARLVGFPRQYKKIQMQTSYNWTNTIREPEQTSRIRT